MPLMSLLRTLVRCRSAASALVERWRSSSSCSRRCIAAGVVGLRVVVAEEVEQPVHDEQRELVVERRAVLGGLAARRPPGRPRRRRAPSAARRPRPASPGRARLRRGGARRAGRRRSGTRARRSGRAVEEAAVEVGDRLLVDEQQRHLGVGGHALVVEHRAGEPRPAREVDLDRRPARRSRRGSLVGARPSGSGPRLVALVRVDDVLHDAVAHDVVRVELDEREVVDAVEDAADREQARSDRVPRAGRSG